MTQTFTTFKTFPDVNQAKEFKRFLIQNNIRSILKDNYAYFETHTPATALKEYEVKVKTTEFDTALKLADNLAEKKLSEVGEEHYLFSCNNDQLYGILLQKEKNSELDYKLAKRLLTERGKPTDRQIIENLKAERVKQQAKPRLHQGMHIFAGYILALLGGFAGIIIGYLMWSSQKQLPNGITLYSHTHTERKHGKIIFGLGILIFAYLLSIKLFVVAD